MKSVRRFNRFIARGRLLLRQVKLGRIRKPVIAVFGGTVLLVGIAMIVLPGPAIVVIPLGLAILAMEFLWARRWLKRLRRFIPGSVRKAQVGIQPSVRA